MKKYLITLGIAAPFIALANGDDGEMGMMHQIEESLPFDHFAHGHWLTGIITVILWVALVYGIYGVIKKKKNGM